MGFLRRLARLARSLFTRRRMKRVKKKIKQLLVAAGRQLTNLARRHQRLMATNASYREAVLALLSLVARKARKFAPAALVAVAIYGTL